MAAHRGQQIAMSSLEARLHRVRRLAGRRHAVHDRLVPGAGRRTERARVSTPAELIRWRSVPSGFPARTFGSPRPGREVMVYDSRVPGRAHAVGEARHRRLRRRIRDLGRSPQPRDRRRGHSRGAPVWDGSMRHSRPHRGAASSRRSTKCPRKGAARQSSSRHPKCAREPKASHFRDEPARVQLDHVFGSMRGCFI